MEKAAGQPKYNLELLETPCSSTLTEGIDSDHEAWNSARRSSSVGQRATFPASGFGRGNSTSSECSGPRTRLPDAPAAGSISEETLRLMQTPATGCSSVSRSRLMQTPTNGSGSFMRSRSTPNRGTLSSGQSRTTPGTRTPGSRGKSPGSRVTPSESSGAKDNTAVIVAIIESRGKLRGEVGMASMDLKRPVLTLSQFGDNQSYTKVMTKLHILRPVEIVLPRTACEGGTMTNLFKQITDRHQNANISTIQRKYFDDTRGQQYIKQLCHPEFRTVELEVKTKFCCVAATAALLKYVEFIQNVVYAHSSLKIVFKGSEETMMIDAATAQSLELMNNFCGHKNDCLYAILNNTRTLMGARLLRANILQPPIRREMILQRLEVVAELTESAGLRYSLHTVLGRFVDMDYLLSLCVMVPKQENIATAERKITNVILLKHTLALIAPLQEVLQEGKNTLMKGFHQSLADPAFDLMMSKIQTVIHDDTRYQKGLLNMKTQKCFAVKPNINGLLDVARRTYSEIVDDMSELVEGLAGEYNLPLKLGYNATRGFHIQIRCGIRDKTVLTGSLPGVFIKVMKYKNLLCCTTSVLIKLNDRVNESLQEIYLMTNVVVSELMNEIRGHMGCLYKLTDCVSLLDMLASFAHNCTLSEYVRPDFSDTLAIKQGRHPILDRISSEPPVPNNVYAAEGSNFTVITGPNMSGKSTYLRQIALLQIMAQIGSFVPAEYACFKIMDQIFSRITNNDDIETNASTFGLEMREINYIVKNASAASLIIIDELGRGTSADEGVGICHAICEYLLKLPAFTFFTTHFPELTNLDQLYPGVENYHFEVQRSYSDAGHCHKFAYTHVLSKGKAQEKHYGIELAEVSAVPAQVLSSSKEVLEELSAQAKRSQQADSQYCKQKAVFRLANRLAQTAENSKLDEASLRAYLTGLRDQYLKDRQEASSAGEE